MKHQGWLSLLWKTVFRIGVMLLAGLLLLYIFLYRTVPDHYFSTAWKEVKGKFSQLSAEIDGGTFDEACRRIDLFAAGGNLDAVLADDSGRVVYSVAALSEDVLIQSNPNWWLVKGQVLSAEEMRTTDFTGYDDLPDIVRYVRPVLLDGGEYRLVCTWSAQNIHKVTQLLNELFPITLILIIIGALLGAFVYAKVFTAPVIAAAKKAERFSGKPDRRRRPQYRADEIGTLQYGLDVLHEQLQEKIRELESQNENLEDSMQRILKLEKEHNDFFAAASHELKTPIAASQAMLEGMIQQVGTYRDREKYLRECRRQMSRLSRLVEEILELSRLNEKTYRQDERVDLDELLSQLMKDYEYLAERFAVTLEYRPGWRAVVCTNRQLLYKALSNALANAIRHGETGGLVRLSLDRHGQGMELDISNEGWIEEERLSAEASVFERKEDGRSGCGFGLYFIRTILTILQLPYELRNGQDGRVHFTVYFSADLLTDSSGKDTISS